MVQIRPLKYEKDEEAILVRSFLLGMFVGLPLGVLANYAFGFPMINQQTPVASDLFGWSIMLMAIFFGFLMVPLIVTIVFLVLFLRRKEN